VWGVGGRRVQEVLTKGEEMSMRSTLRLAAAPIAGAAITSTLLVGGAAAQPLRDEPSAASPAIASATLGGFAAAGGLLTQAPGAPAPRAGGLPSAARHPGHRCIGQTDNPHNSRHFPGDASVSSRTVCRPHAVAVTVWLYKRVNGSWRLLDTGSDAGVGRTQANAHGPCGRRGTTHRFVGIAYHTATGHAPAATRNARTVTCR
jgi:hypothetical protein